MGFEFDHGGAARGERRSLFRSRDEATLAGARFVCPADTTVQSIRFVCFSVFASYLAHRGWTETARMNEEITAVSGGLLQGGLPFSCDVGEVKEKGGSFRGDALVMLILFGIEGNCTPMVRPGVILIEIP